MTAPDLDLEHLSQSIRGPLRQSSSELYRLYHADDKHATAQQQQSAEVSGPQCLF